MILSTSPFSLADKASSACGSKMATPGFSCSSNASAWVALEARTHWQPMLVKNTDMVSRAQDWTAMINTLCGSMPVSTLTYWAQGDSTPEQSSDCTVGDTVVLGNRGITCICLELIPDSGTGTVSIVAA